MVFHFDNTAIRWSRVGTMAANSSSLIPRWRSTDAMQSGIMLACCCMSRPCSVSTTMVWRASSLFRLRVTSFIDSMRLMSGVSVLLSRYRRREMAFKGRASCSQSTISTKYCVYVMPNLANQGWYTCISRRAAV